MINMYEKKSHTMEMSYDNGTDDIFIEDLDIDCPFIFLNIPQTSLMYIQIFTKAKKNTKDQAKG